MARSNQAKGNGVVEDRGRVGDLVRGAADGHAKGGSAGFAMLHYSAV